jgi:hypothetical protein
MKHAAALAVSSSPLVTFGALQMLGSAQTPQWPALADDFLNLHFWLTMLVVFVGGAFGGISYELLLRGGAIELPHRVRPGAVGRSFTHAPPESLIATGIVGRAMVGAAAALAVLLVAAPSTAQAAIAVSVTSGAAAPAVIRVMRRHLLAAAEALSRVNVQSKSPHPARSVPALGASR